MKNKKKIAWMSFNIVLLGFLLHTTGIADFSYENGDFCYWGLFCSDDYLDDDYLDGYLDNIIWTDMDLITYYPNCFEYEFRQEGVVAYGYPYNESFFITLEKVIEVSENENSDIIKEISDSGTFEDIYHKYIDIFQDNYSLEIDECSPMRDYIQNIGELISNNYHGDCDDYAMLLYLIAKEKGLEVRYVIGYSEYSGHAWIQIKINGEWIDYNSTSNSIGINVISGYYSEIYYYSEEKDENE